MASLLHSLSRSLRPSSSHALPSSPTSPRLSLIVSSFFALSFRRRIIIVATFLIGFVLTMIMKREQLLWLLTSAAGATPILEFGQGSLFDFPGLRFGLDRQFKITVFEDLHFGEEAWAGPDCPDCASYDSKSVKALSNILKWEPTNLAVLNGDLLTGEAVPAENYTQYIDHIVQPLVQRKIPWASTYGNHDRSSKCSPRVLLEREQSFNSKNKKLAWTDSFLQGEDAKVGTSNYFIPIYSSSGGGSPNLVLILWFFDSRAGGTFQQTTPDGKDIPLEDFVAPKVVSWFNAVRADMKQTYDRVIPSLAFVHIPIEASWGLQNVRSKDKSIAPGINAEIIGHQANTCDAQGNCSYNGQDSAFMKALVGTEGLMAVFSGHDHAVDWCMKWSNDRSLPNTIPASGNGLNVCFGRRTGYGGYNKQFLKGARKIVIYEDDLDKREIETWVRLENGNISAPIVLNSTYGKDRYPAAPNQG